MADPKLPVMTLAEAQPYLRRPFSPTAIRFKIQSAWPRGENTEKKGGMVVAYIDARLVIERLDEVLGPNWSDRYEIVPGTKALKCSLTLDGVTREDIGEHGHSTKATASDALKRAAVRFGVGISVYSMSRVNLNAGDGKMNGSGKGARPTLRKKGKSLEISDECEEWLRGRYAAWLSNGAGKRFGEPLGAEEDPEAIGLDEHEQSVPVEGEQTSLEAAASVTELEQLYESIPVGVRRKELPRAKFDAQLRACEGDASKLAGLRKAVEGLK